MCLSPILRICFFLEFISLKMILLFYDFANPITFSDAIDRVIWCRACLAHSIWEGKEKWKKGRSRRQTLLPTEPIVYSRKPNSPVFPHLMKNTNYRRLLVWSYSFSQRRSMLVSAGICLQTGQWAQIWFILHIVMWCNVRQHSRRRLAC